MTVIPGGCHTYSKKRFAFEGPVPHVVEGQGCWIECNDGQGYVDTVAGLGCITLGYRDPQVDDAIRDQLAAGISFSLPTNLEEQVGQDLLDFLDWGERVRFSKNGADVTNLAVRLARAHTGRERREKVMALDYHGHDDWCQVRSTDQRAGIPIVFSALVDDCATRILAESHCSPGVDDLSDVATVILEPIPSDGSPRSTEDLTQIATWARERGALLIYDCMVTGMRLNRRGWPDEAPAPDLACYGKAMGNGMPLSACVGSAELLDRITEDVFFSTTFGGECLSLAAAQAVLKAYPDRRVLQRLWETGDRLNATLNATAYDHGLQEQLQIVSYPARPFHQWRTTEQAETFARAMLHHGILYQGYHNLMLATCHEDPITMIEGAYEVACQAVAAL